MNLRSRESAHRGRETIRYAGIRSVFVFHCACLSAILPPAWAGAPPYGDDPEFALRSALLPAPTTASAQHPNVLALPEKRVTGGEQYRVLDGDSVSRRSFGDAFDLAVQWFCASGGDYLPDTGSGPGPCLQQTYDGVSEVCGTNSHTGVPINIVESETDNGDGTTTIIVQAASADGSAMIPLGAMCDGDAVSRGTFPIDTVGCDLAKQDAGGPGIPGDPLDPALGVSPFVILDADAVIFGTGGQTLLSFNLNSEGTTRSDLKDRFTVGGVNQIAVTAMQFRYRIATGPPAGACCLGSGPDAICQDGVRQSDCVAKIGLYFGDFSTCAEVPCGSPANDDCSSAQGITDGVTTYDTTDATLDMAAPVPCDPNMINDVWYSYTGTCTGTLTVDTCANGAGGDTVLEVFKTADCPPPATRAACEDDSGCGVAGQSARVTLSVTVGENFLIRLAGSDGVGLTGNMTVTCTGQTPIGGACCTGPMSCVNVSSAVACGGTYLGDGTTCGISFAVQALSMTAHFDTCGSTYNTVLEVFDVCGGTCLAVNDDCADTASGGAADPSAPCFGASPQSGERDSCTCVASTVGQGYYVRVTNFGGGPPPPGSNTSLFVTHGGPCNSYAAGACCTFGNCADNVREGYCAPGGTYQGDNSKCANVICPEPTGACCYTDGSCLNPVHRSDCVTGGNHWFHAAACANVNCKCVGDMNGDRTVSTEDWSGFLACFAGPDAGLLPGCASADLDGDGDCDLADVAEFLRRFQQPCP